jgi:hypothetical protein
MSEQHRTRSTIDERSRPRGRAVALDLGKGVYVLVDHEERRVGLGTRGPCRPGAPCACYIAMAS